MQDRFRNIQLLSVKPRTQTLYSALLDTVTGEFIKGKKSISEESRKNLNKEKYQGFMSPNAIRRCRNAVDYFLYYVDPLIMQGKNRHKVGFVTLTLASKQIHSDNEIKSKLLNQLLVELRKHYSVDIYVWKAEKQKNGNLHFHILTDKFIPYKDLRERWNRIQNKLGYVDRSVSKNPNSTDIHTLYKDKKGSENINDVAMYIAKYMSKSENPDHLDKEQKNKLKVEGRLWFVSQKISKICKGVTLFEDKFDSDALDVMEKIHKERLKRAKREKEIEESEYFTCYLCTVEDMRKHGLDTIVREFDTYIQECRGYKIEIKEKDFDIGYFNTLKNENENEFEKQNELPF